MFWWTAIVGGQPAPVGQWPDAVAIFGRDGEVCSGTLIAPEWVLTAGHCVGMQRVVLGTNDHEEGGQIRNVSEQFIHNDATVTFDLSLLQLAEPVLDLEPRELLRGCLADFLLNGQNVTVAGFGRLNRDGDENTSLLHEVELPIVDHDCSVPDRGCRDLIGPGAEFIAGGDGLDSCSGDSGGPAYLTIDDTSWLAGVVSRSALPFDTPCGDGGIYVRVDAAVPWIREITGLPFANPTCAGLNLPPHAPDQQIELEQGASVVLSPEVIDANPADTHTLTVLLPPARGHLNGLVYRADPFQLGREVVVLEITDDGLPARSSTVEITLNVLPAGSHQADASGCSTVSFPWSQPFELFARRR